MKPTVKISKDFFVLDTETGEQFKDGSIQWGLKARPDAFVFGVIYGYNFSKIIHNRLEFINELKDPRYKNKWVFMHNAEYDLGVLYGNIISDLDPNAIFNGKFISATNSNCKFADSTNIFGRVKLSELATMLSMEKPQLGNTAMFSQKLGPEEINRCYMDCVILWDALILMFEFAGAIKITQASLSMTYYRRFHQPYHIDHNENTKHFWDSYFGGRTEIFKIGPTYSRAIDINSSYPFAMLNSKFPNPKFLKVETDVNPSKVDYYLQNFEGCTYCTVNHADYWMGFLPVKSKEGKLIFPVGTFSGCWNFNELRYGLDMGVISIKSIQKIIYSEPMQSPFKSFVNSLYKQRLEATNKFETYRIKIFMSSLYGKFAQRISEESIYLDNVEKNLDLIRDYQRRGLFIKLQMFNAERLDAFLIIKSLTGKAISYAIPSFSSYITSFARIHLLKQLIKMKDQKPVYCDTDSIFFEIDKGFVNDNELGGWKLEPKIITEINGLKNYKFFTTAKPENIIHRIKGVPLKNTLISPGVFEYKNLIKTKEGLRRNIDSGILTTRIKKIVSKYDKRIVLENGETKPLTL